jgi:uncharacterized protein (DUF488 family)
VKVSPWTALKIFTIGHSNRSLEDFLSLLKQFGVRVVADIRRYPSSRKFPHFNREILRKSLGAEGIRYLWFENLGGRRHKAIDKDSPNVGLESPGFRNYADHMLTEDFRAAVRELLFVTGEYPTSIMCAERFYWKCHRRLLSDYLVAQGLTVEHILDDGKLQPHGLTEGAVVTKEATVVYPQAQPGLWEPR